MFLSDMGVVLTAWRRPNYTRRALESWSQVKEVASLAAFRVCIDPSDRQEEVRNTILHIGSGTRQFWGKMTREMRVNPEHRGVSGNPADSLTDLFQENPKLRFGIVADDDMVVSDDILRYFQWCAEKWEDDHRVAAVCAHTPEPADADASAEEVHLLPRYRCWVWGTWRDRWFDLLEPTWDRDYSSGEPAGYDWNLDLRVIPGNGKVCAFPAASRTQNIGRFEGVHAQPGDFAVTINPSWRERRGKVEYRYAEG